MKLAIIGSKGMLGSVVNKYLSKSSNDFEIIIARRLERNNINKFLDSIENADYVINCSGAIPQRAPIFKNNNEILDYYKINYQIPELLLKNNFKVIHPCTDCVFKGDPKLAPYSLDSKYDCEDFYGQSKAQLFFGNTYKNNINSIKVIRASIVGPDYFNKSLYSWTLSMMRSARSIEGYINHFWNGITTLKWAEICLDIISNFNRFPSISVYGTNTISKYELIKKIIVSNNYSADEFLIPVKANEHKNKSLFLGRNNFGDIYPLLKKLTEFEMIMK